MSSTTPPAQVRGALPAGTRVGPYRVVRRLAVGRVAELLLSKTTGLGGFERVVALKRMLPQHARNEALVRTFLDEARLASTLRHDNIAQVHDVGKAGSTYFFAMEYVDGADVRAIWQAARWTGQPVPIEQAVAIARGAAAGLHHAHERVDPASGRALGIVHGGISPSKIVVGFDGTVKLVDFGTARASASEGGAAGEPGYRAPEQRRGKQPDRLGDIYALGVVLYELTTGKLLTAEQAAGAAPIPRPAAVVPGYPRALERVVRRAMAPRLLRYRTARALEAALEKVSRELRLPGSTSSLMRYLRSLDLPPSPLAEADDSPPPAREAPEGATTVWRGPAARGWRRRLLILQLQLQIQLARVANVGSMVLYNARLGWWRLRQRPRALLALAVGLGVAAIVLVAGAALAG